MKQFWKIILAGICSTAILTGALSGALAQNNPAESSSTASFVYLPVVKKNAPLMSLFGVESSDFSLGGGGYYLNDLRSSWVRRNALDWSKVQPDASTYDWSTMAGLESDLINASNSGVRVVLIVRGTPAWAQEKPGYSCGPIRNNPAFPGNQFFANFMAEAVRRYSKPPFIVHYWEIWNEPDVDSSYFQPNTNPVYGCWGEANDPYYGGGRFGAMLRSIYPAMKAADRGAQVIVGGLLLDCNPAVASCNEPQASRFLEGILRENQQAGLFAFDGVAYHAYDYYGEGGVLALGRFHNPNWNTRWNTNGPVLEAKAKFLRAVLEQYGVSGKFLMNTESALLRRYGACDAACEETKAYYVVQAYVTSFANQLKANIWYNLYGWENSGLLGPGGPLPAYDTFRRTRLLLGPATAVMRYNDFSGLVNYRFVRQAGEVWVYWSLDGAPHSVHLDRAPASLWSYSSAQKKYVETVNPGQDLTVGVGPVFVEFNP